MQQDHGDQPERRDGRFVWPPISARSAPTREPVAAERPDADGGRGEPFRGRSSVPPGGATNGVWPAVERTWLDLTVPPLLPRLADSGWVPDVTGAYCGACGSTVGPHEIRGGRCSECADRRLPWDRLIRLGEYRWPLKRLIQEVKYTGWRRLGLDLGRLLGEAVAVELEAAVRIGGGADGVRNPNASPLVVPVPMAMIHRLYRGVDHAAAIAQGVAERTDGRVVQPLRRAHRPSQTDVSAAERRRNVAGAFRRRRLRVLEPELRDRLVIVVDDVTTTGATLRATCRAIRRLAATSAGGPGNLGIWAAVVAKTPDPRRRASAGGSEGSEP